MRSMSFDAEVGFEVVELPEGCVLGESSVLNQQMVFQLGVAIHYAAKVSFLVHDLRWEEVAAFEVIVGVLHDAFHETSFLLHLLCPDERPTFDKAFVDPFNDGCSVLFRDELDSEDGGDEGASSEVLEEPDVLFDIFNIVVGTGDEILGGVNADFVTVERDLFEQCSS